ncbi:MAG TPA: NADH-quinone oxidoreductase subunit J family protein [Candidatus Hypogeohydataceae bacterium YC40]
MENLFFYIAAMLAIVSASSVILQRKVMYSVLSLIVTLLSVAWMYAMLSAPFPAVVQVILYAGAIMVLFLFVVMMLKYEKTETFRFRPGLLWCLGLVAAIAFLIEIVLPLNMTESLAPAATALAPGFGSIKSLGSILYTQYLLPIELTGILLLVAVVGVALLSGVKKE